ncbi:steroid 3-ketoacyl-CoA thiolase [Nocardioides sp. YIM 152315]|uniref:steroid 3-ketoacyl-CoA thiolase n=1 Tax=Nocardioides sp. YIM 152315 TaxID=3031760 RepID=UPI0023DB513E|nr:steroid 3-ketoacyl-CoA thiolase [Nocardioides sp. YIM 152315]MDF1604678.1 steroid 3-ketoacyl-CoA thiolase [Nocardioides sp. YIM 152315]
MSTAVIVDAARSPFGRRGGPLAAMHPAELLGHVQRGVLERAGVAPEEVGEVVGGCVTQAGEQSGGIARVAWLHAGLPEGAGVTTIDAQCASGQQAAHLIAAQIAVGAIDVGVACGVEVMSRVPLLANIGEGAPYGRPRPEGWTIDMPTQYVAAERIAERRGFTREQVDAFGLRSQQRARAAWDEGRLARQVLPVKLPDGTLVERDGGLRETSAEALAALKPVVDGGLHTAGTASQISDGATAAVLMSERRADDLGLRPRARIRHQCLVGGETRYLLDGPIRAADTILARAGMTVDDVDLFEVNEAFASVAMSFAQVHGVPDDKLNVNGGAIALGHPVGATGVRLLATVIDELERTDKTFGLIATCAGGAMAVGTLVERL